MAESIYNVPKGIKHASKTFQVTVRKGQRCSRLTLRVLKTKSTKKIPWTGPMAFTQLGSCAMYLSGTATKTSNSREIPSKKAISRNRPTEVVKNELIKYRRLESSKKWPGRERRKGPRYGNKNNQKGQCKPEKHGFEFIVVGGFSFC